MVQTKGGYGLNGAIMCTLALTVAIVAVTATNTSPCADTEQLSVSSTGRKLQQVVQKEGSAMARTSSGPSIHSEKMLESPYNCDEFVLRMSSSTQASQALRQAAATTTETTSWALDHPLLADTQTRHQVMSAELNSCRNVLQVRGTPDANILAHLAGPRLESVTTVSPSSEPSCNYRPSASRPNVLYRHAPQLLREFTGDMHFDCVVDLGVGCHGPQFAEALLQYVSAADIAVIGAGASHGRGCARAAVEKATDAGMQMVHVMHLDVATGDAADEDHLTHTWRSIWVLRRPSFKTCQLLNVTYHPSQLEQQWMQRVSSQPFNSFDSYCSETLQFLKPFSEWLDYTGNLSRRGSNSNVSVLSQHKYTYQCGKDSIQSVAYLEPLAGHLRYPLAWCHNFLLRKGIKLKSSTLKNNTQHVNIVRYDYLLLASAAEPPSKSVRTFLFDVGARTYAIGVGRFPNGTRLPAQKFLVDTYKSNGITFDRMLLWDPQPKSADIFSAAPQDLLPAYSYYNFGASSADDNTNPLVVIKKLCKASDFVVLKMDIDLPELEEAWLEQLADDKELLMLVDEFFYEFNPIEAGWQKLGQLYQLMTSMRNAGVRAHGWI